MTSHNGARLALAAGAFALAAACSGGDGPGNPGPKGGDDRVPTSLRLSSQTLALRDGDSTRLTVTVFDQNGTAYSAPPSSLGAVGWVSGNVTIASVAAGQVKGEHRGQAWVFAQAGSLKDSALVTVSPVATQLAVVRGDGQSAAAGTLLADSVAVRVLDRRGDGVGGVSVDFVVTTGGGSATPATVQTDSAGNAKTAWRLGTLAGSNALEARSAGLAGSPRAFTARTTAGPAAKVQVVSGDAQSGTVGAALASPLVVRVTDANGNAAAGAAVTWIVTSGGGTVGATSSTTDSTGRAQTGWTLGTTAGAQAVRASAAGDTAGFHATASSGALAAVDLKPDSAAVSVGDTLRFTARPVDAFGNTVAVAGAPTWTSNPTSIITVSTTGLVTAVAPGTGYVTAAWGNTRISSAVRVRGPAHVAVSPRADTLTSLGDTVRLHAAATDSAGKPVSVVFAWKSLDTAVVSVSATGLVTARKNGPAYVVASSAGVSDTALVTVSQVAASLRVDGDSASVPVGSTRYFYARVYDARGNAMAAVPSNAVTWSLSNPSTGYTKAFTSTTPGLSVTKVVGVAPGSGAVRAVYGALQGAVPVRVIPDPVLKHVPSQYGASFVQGPSGTMYDISGDYYSRELMSLPAAGAGWRVTADPCSLHACLVADDSENLYVRGTTGVKSYVGATGALRWSVPLADGSGNMAEGSGRLFVQAGNLLYALSTATGAVLWQHDLGHGVKGLTYDQARGTLYAAVDVYFCNGCSNYTANVVALDPATGVTRWGLALMYMVDAPFGLAADGTLYAQGHNGNDQRLMAITPAGALVWATQTDWASVSAAAPLVDASGRIVFTTSRSVVALSPSGAVLWRWIPSVSDPYMNLGQATPAVDAAGVVYVLVSGDHADATGLAAVRDGVELWIETRVGWDSGASYVGGSGHLVIARDGKLYMTNGLELVVASTNGFPTGVQWPMGPRDPGGQFRN